MKYRNIIKESREAFLGILNEKAMEKHGVTYKVARNSGGEMTGVWQNSNPDNTYQDISRALAVSLSKDGYKLKNMVTVMDKSGKEADGSKKAHTSGDFKAS